MEYRKIKKKYYRNKVLYTKQPLCLTSHIYSMQALCILASYTCVKKITSGIYGICGYGYIWSDFL